MKDLAPEITRQRLLAEGFYTIDVNKETIELFFKEITKSLNLQMYGTPIVFSTGGEGKEINQGYDAFVPLVDSGISVYVWSNSKFLSLIIYTCRSFDEKEAIRVVKEFFRMEKIEFQSF